MTCHREGVCVCARTSLEVDCWSVGGGAPYPHMLPLFLLLRCSWRALTAGSQWWLAADYAYASKGSVPSRARAPRLPP